MLQNGHEIEKETKIIISTAVAVSVAADDNCYLCNLNKFAFFGKKKYRNLSLISGIVFFLSSQFAKADTYTDILINHAQIP